MHYAMIQLSTRSPCLSRRPGQSKERGCLRSGTYAKLIFSDIY